MGKELFNQPLIESPDLPADDLQIAFSKPGVQGGFNVAWAYFKQLIQGALNFIAFIPQNPAPTEAEGVMFYDDITKAFSGWTHITGVPPYRFSRTLRSRVINNTVSVIPKGDICKIVDLDGILPVVEPAQANILKAVQTSIGMAMKDIPAGGGDGLLAVFDSLVGVNTFGMTVNDLIYLSPDNAGKFVNVRPQAPDYALPVGFVAVVDAVNGVIGVRFGGFDGSDTSVNLEGTLNGMVTQTPDVAFSVTGGIIHADITNEAFPAKNLPFVLDFDRQFLNTTTNTGPGGSARVVIPPGGDPSLAQSAQKSWIYVFLNGGTPDIAVSTSKPSMPHAIIGTVVAYNAATTLARGNVHGYRRENNASDSKAEGIVGTYGFTRVVADDARSRGSAWDEGQDPTPDIDDLTIQLALSSGVGKQLHYSATGAFNGLLYEVYNDSANAITYEELINLIDITLDSNGNTLLGNGFYYTLRFYYRLNSNGIGNTVIVTRPKGHYSSGELAEADALNLTTLLTDTLIEDIVYPLYDIVIAKTGGGGATTTMFSITSLRSKTPGAAGGGGGAPITTDDKVRASAADTTNDYLTAKISVTGALKTIINPGGNEILDFKVNTLYTPDGASAVVTTNNAENVGINKADPSTKLQIAGGHYSRTISSNGTSGSPVYDILISGGNTSTPSVAGVEIFNQFSSNFGAGLRFFTQASGSATKINTLTLAPDGAITAIDTLTAVDFILS